MISAISFALALLLSSALVPIAMRYAVVLGVVDTPDEQRKFHTQPIPRVGGLAIVIAFFIPVFIWAENVSGFQSFLIGAAIIAVFGFLDDRHDLSYRWKFFGQIVAVAVFMIGNLEITKTPFLGLGDNLPWLSYPIIALFLLGVTNAVNLSDGLDGLAAGSSLLSLGFLAALSYVAADHVYTIFAVAAMGGLTGFLRFNTHPASVFMGDSGSQFLGYITGCLALMVTQSENVAVSPVLPLLIVGLPILDTLMVMALRLRDGVSPFKPDRRHLHHQFLAAGFKHYQAVIAIYVLSFALLALAYAVRFQSDGLILQAYIMFVCISLGLLAFIQHSPVAKKRRQRIAANQERRNTLLRRIDWLHTQGGHLVQYALGLVWCFFVVAGTHQSTGLSLAALAGLLMLLILHLVFRGDNRVLARVIFYGASVLAVASITFGEQFNWPHWQSLKAYDGLLIGLVALLGLVIRTTRKEQFSLDTQDVLVLLVLISAPLLSQGSLAEAGLARNETAGAVVRLAILLYAAEYVIARLSKVSLLMLFSAAGFSLYLLRAFVL